MRSNTAGPAHLKGKPDWPCRCTKWCTCKCAMPCTSPPKLTPCKVPPSVVAGGPPANATALAHPRAPPRLPGLCVNNARPKDAPHLVLGLCFDQVYGQQLCQRSCTGVGRGAE